MHSGRRPCQRHGPPSPARPSGRTPACPAIARCITSSASRAEPGDIAIAALVDHLNIALQRRWPGIIAQVVAAALLWGALVLAWTALGLSRAWEGVPVPARALDVVLIGFNLAAAIGLWRLRAWGVLLLYAGALGLQFVPYVLLRGLFVADPRVGVTVNTLLIFECLFLVLFALVLARAR